MATPQRKGKGKPPAAPWADLAPDALQHMAQLLPPRDRYKLNIVCASWREGLREARQCWQELTINPRRKASSSRRVRYTKHLPTPAAVGAWFAAYGRHVSRLHLRHLDAGSAAVGCVGEADLPALLAAAAGSLQQMTVQQCRVQSLLAHSSSALADLAQLTSLHVTLHHEEPGLSLGTPELAFITALTRLEDLAISTGWRGAEHHLPASLAALPRLRSLQLARVSAAGHGVFEGGDAGDACILTVARGLAALTALQRLLVSQFLLVEEEPPGDEALPDQLRMPPALWGLPAITSLILSDVGLGQRQLVLAPVGYAPGLYPLPTAISRLAPLLRELSLLQHACSTEELATLSTLTGLTSLALTARWRQRATPLPDALACLSGLVHLRISHGLQQVPPCITGLTQLTFLDLSFNAIKTIKPGPYLKQLVAVNLRANLFTHFPSQLRVARRTCQELHLPQNDSMEVSERDVEQLLTFEQLRQLTIFGASESSGTRRSLAQLQREMPWLLLDV